MTTTSLIPQELNPKKKKKAEKQEKKPTKQHQAKRAGCSTPYSKHQPALALLSPWCRGRHFYFKAKSQTILSNCMQPRNSEVYFFNVLVCTSALNDIFFKGQGGEHKKGHSWWFLKNFVASLQTTQEIKQCQQFITPRSDWLHIHLSDVGTAVGMQHWESISFQSGFEQFFEAELFTRLKSPILSQITCYSFLPAGH